MKLPDKNQFFYFDDQLLVTDCIYPKDRLEERW